ncbi:hypothetical protein BDZ91DRAFT_102898 [Kalaharituber pfeilii]|nr:hypothetical protein BDZ91DRAFT_102898 [Kalaharituber pfeilii]
MPSTDIKWPWKQRTLNCHSLVRKRVGQGILELDTTAPLDANLPIGAAFTISKHSGLYIDVGGLLTFLLDGTFLRVWKSDFSRMTLSCATPLYTTMTTPQHRSPCFSSAQVRSIRPSSSLVPCPTGSQTMTTGEFSRRRTSSRTPRGLKPPVRGYMSFTFGHLQDYIVRRDMILCMKGSPEEAITLIEGRQARMQALQL